MQMIQPPRLERALPEDGAELAELYLAANDDALPYVRRGHSDDEVRRWVRQVMLTQGETWVARLHGRILGFLTLDGCELEQLFLLPGFYRRGIGSLLLNKAKERSPARLRLFAFRRNLRARAFYESHGFRIAGVQDGEAQDEPDIAYEWTGAALPHPPPRGTLVNSAS